MKRLATRSFFLLFGLLVLAMFVGAVVWRLTAEEDISWEDPTVCGVSERFYVADQGRSLIEQWQLTRDELRPGLRPDLAAYDVILTVDLTKRAMWVERDGRVWRGNYFDLPKKLAWSLHLVDADGDHVLARLARFKIRDWEPGDRERVYFVGNLPQGGHLVFAFNSWLCETVRGAGGFKPGSDYVPRQYAEPQPSILVSDEEYSAAVRPTTEQAAEVGAGDQTDEVERVLQEHRADWVRIAAKLYLEIEHRIERKGMHLDELEVCPGPDYHAGHVELRIHLSSVRRPFEGGGPINGTLRFEYLGDGVWYAKSGAGGYIELEFLVAAGDRIPGSESDWMERGREKLKRVSLPPSPWRVDLPNGARVEFIGVCNAPSLGRQWWGPDGRPLEVAPYFRTRALGERPDRRRFEFAYRVIRPQNATSGSTGTRFSGCLGGGGGSEAEDRYGSRPQDMACPQREFPAAQGMTTLRIQVGVDKGEKESAEFRNISLVPGKDFGFEAVAVPAEE